MKFFVADLKYLVIFTTLRVHYDFMLQDLPLYNTLHLYIHIIFNAFENVWVQVNIIGKHRRR